MVVVLSRQEPDVALARTRKQALAAVAKVPAGDSELHELWAEAGDAPSEWLEVLAEAEARVSA